MRSNLLFLSLLVFLLFCSCSASKKAIRAKNDPIQKPQLLNDDTFKLIGVSEDATYGYSEKNPIKVGGISPQNERRFLNALAGPNGEPIRYERNGSCCAFTTPNGLMNDTGLLDMYEIQWEGIEQAVIIYINMYDYPTEALKAPKGFTVKG